MLDYWRKTGWAGRKLVAFAEVNSSNPDEIEAAIAIFGGVILGVNVLKANNDQFAARQPWDWKAGSPSLGGHAILGGSYTNNPGANIQFITWARRTAFTDRCIQKQCFEAWIPVFPEHLGTKSFLAGVNGRALASAFKDLTGEDLVIPDPPKPPVVPDDDRIAKLETEVRSLRATTMMLAREVGKLMR